MNTRTAIAPPTARSSAATTLGAPIEISKLVKTFRRADGSDVPAIDGIDMRIEPGEFLVLVGPSGCGKTTLLRTIAGLERAQTGRISIGDDVAFDAETRTNLPPERRRLSMIFQSYALWPHLSVLDNVSYPLRRGQRVAKADAHRRAREVMDLVGIDHLARQHPGAISGGQQQRVALARALVAQSGVVLFDEPLSNVDAKVREQLRWELLEMQRRVGFTAVYVTHDQTEAMGLGDRIAVLRAGRVAQIGSPKEIYMHPTSQYVAHFMGAANELQGKVAEVAGDLATIESPLGRLIGRTHPAAPVSVGSAAAAVWRPESSRLGLEPEGHGQNRLSVRPQLQSFLGPYTENVMVAGGQQFRVRESGAGSEPSDSGEQQLVFAVSDTVVLPSDTHAEVK